MINTSQAWKDNQQKQLRSESDVRITFYSLNNYKLVSNLGTINKVSLKDFSFSESGSIIGNQRYDVNIRFSLLKSSLQTIDYPSGSFIKIEFGYYLNGAWEYIDRGYFELVEKVNKANSFTIDYVAKHINYNLLSRDYKLGMLLKTPKITMQDFIEASIKGLLTNYESSPSNYLKGDLMVSGDTTWYYYDGGGLTTYRGVADFPIMPYLDIFQVSSQAMGCAYRLLGYKDSNDNYYLDYKLYDFLNTDFSNSDFSFSVNDINYLKYPENITQDKYKQVDCYAQSVGILFDTGGSTYTLPATTKIAYFPDNFRNRSIGTRYKYYFTGGVVGTYNQSSTLDGIATSYCAEEKYEITNVIDNTQINELKVSNPFAVENSSFYNGWVVFTNSLMLKHANNNKIYDLDLRIDPSVELYDKVVYNTTQGGHDCVVESYTIRFNGAFSGTMRIRENLTLVPPFLYETPTIYNDSGIAGDGEYRFKLQNNNDFVANITIDGGGQTLFNIPANSQVVVDNFDYENMNASLVQICEDCWFRHLNKSIYAYTAKDGNITSKTILLERNDNVDEIIAPKINFTHNGLSWSLNITNQPNNFALKVAVYCGATGIEGWENLPHYVQPFGDYIVESAELDDDNVITRALQLYLNGELDSDLVCYFYDYDEILELPDILLLKANA